jgi:hypothetical protein
MRVSCYGFERIAQLALKEYPPERRASVLCPPAEEAGNLGTEQSVTSPLRVSGGLSK